MPSPAEPFDSVELSVFTAAFELALARNRWARGVIRIGELYQAEDICALALGKYRGRGRSLEELYEKLTNATATAVTLENPQVERNKAIDVAG